MLKWMTNPRPQNSLDPSSLPRIPSLTHWWHEKIPVRFSTKKIVAHVVQKQKFFTQMTTAPFCLDQLTPKWPTTQNFDEQ